MTAYPIVLMRIILMCSVIVIPIVIVIAIVKKNANRRNDDAMMDVAGTPVSSADSCGTATIFINGGAPASGNTMGKITIDGQSLTVRYTDAPVEITISAGPHHVVVEGGVCGDARIDRIIDFDVLDVWTVDLPGGNDDDVIRHQMISYSEYIQALSDADFNVTRKQL